MKAKLRPLLRCIDTVLISLVCSLFQVRQIKNDLLKLLGRFSHSGKATERLVGNLVVARTGKKLKTPAATRWISWFLVSDRFVELKDAIEMVAKEQHLFYFRGIQLKQ